jgi:hypothetical protein
MKSPIEAANDLSAFMDGLKASSQRAHQELVQWNQAIGEPDHFIPDVGTYSKGIGFWRIKDGIFSCPKTAQGLYQRYQGNFHDEASIKLLTSLLEKPIREIHEVG